LLGTTLRYPYEVRKENEYFDDIPDEKIPKDMLDLASHIVETKAGHFEPEKFEDQYEDALKELIRKKQSGQPIERPERREPSKVINLMDALRRSVDASRESAKRAPSITARQSIRTSEEEKIALVFRKTAFDHPQHRPLPRWWRHRSVFIALQHSNSSSEFI
jgi:DNA end-binding protein Ku